MAMKEIVLPIVVCWNLTKKTITKPSATLLKKRKEIVATKEL